MSGAPKRIFATRSMAGSLDTPYENVAGEMSSEYHHEDLSAELVRAALEEAAETCRWYPAPHGNRIAEALQEDYVDNPEAIAAIVAKVMVEQS